MSKVEIAGLDTALLPKLTNAEQIAMLHRIKTGCEQTRDAFIYANLRLVLSVIQKYIKKNVGDDVFQVGCVGLIKAIDNFDPKFGVQFSTYAVPMIIGEIRRFLRDNNSLRVSRSMRDTAYRALVSKEKLTHLLDREPSIDEIAVDIGMAYKPVFFALTATSNTLSLDDVVSDEGSKTISMMDKIADSAPTTENWLEDIMLKKAIRALNIREREILIMRYFHGKTQVEVSREVGISQAQVSRLEKTALDGVKKRL
ncbi:MAG: SigB/SigF/SigG family RNA polymerase sigma factor [Firmicutes bacterium]|nr:SigB/SigF/SigG family RNA polymerase sigma factor [Bacillota bacterium]